ncbi:MAG: hypothetical protein BAJALOKI2v1_20072 [Promethearchaeota archaeon]|nr:MAG: hypothetical protein BAJALOKI2v1_20072 [Candidatus Lokiarchaeota archaeon]
MKTPRENIESPIEGENASRAYLIMTSATFLTKSVNQECPRKDDLHLLANDLLLDVFENILLNAKEYNDNETVQIKIFISRKSDGDMNYVKMEFKDNGIGIEDDRKEAIFRMDMSGKKYSKGRAWDFPWWQSS